MLYQLGTLTIRVAPFNVDRVTTTGATDYASKPVVGAMPPLEYVGEGANTMKLSGKLFPKVIGGLTELAILEGMRTSGSPQYLVRGDGVPLGWYVITQVTSKEDHLDVDGVGQQIDVSISLTKSGRPSRSSLFSLLAGLFK